MEVCPSPRSRYGAGEPNVPRDSVSPLIFPRLEPGTEGFQHPQGHQHLCRFPLLRYHLPPKSGSYSKPPSICPAGKVKSSVIAKSRGTRRIDGDGFPPLFVNKACWPPPQPRKAPLISHTIAVCCANSFGGGQRGVCMRNVSSGGGRQPCG